jgi:4,5:9,10-diseco-3-hydroxy-5,9,17-trioxoandrosta-1(10),2-diene-4-oate hydrolase
VTTQPLSEHVRGNGSSPSHAYGPAGRSEWLDIDWRRHQRWVSVDGQAINTIELGEGEGQPIVFVHGLSGSWPNWLEQLPVFARSHRVLALDLPGFGHSPMPSGEVSMAAYARLLDGLLAARGIDAAVLVGNSMGGFIAAELAIAYPQRVERLVLVSAAGISTYGTPERMRAAGALRRLETVLAGTTAWAAARSDALTRRPRLREAMLKLVVRYPGRLPAALAAEQVRGAGTPGFFDALAAILDYDVRERLAEIACPTLIVWGERDLLISVRDADVFAELIPNARKVIYEDTGHMAMLERPQAFNSLLAGFLAE